MSGDTPLDLDLLVIGGGPAGSACAIRSARHGARVAIVEASDFSRFRIGETIEPSARPLLAELGILAGDDCEWSAPSTGIVSAWGQPSSARRPSMLNPYGRGWRVDRRSLDRALFEQARASGASGFARSRLVAAERRAGRWSFQLDGPAGTRHGSAEWIVAATGRGANAPLAPSRSRRWLDRLIGIALIGDAGEPAQSHAPAPATVEAAPGGWWYSVAIPDGRPLAVFFTDGDLLPKGQRALRAFLQDQLAHGPLTHAGAAFAAQCIERGSWTGFDARSSIRRTAIADGWVAVGDALMAFDPLCGRGVTEALTSGLEVADWLLQAGETRRKQVPVWAASAAQRFNDYCAQRGAVYGMETRWADMAFWQRRHERRRMAS
jgi:flavin-dependent dehydrogenase